MTLSLFLNPYLSQTVSLKPSLVKAASEKSLLTNFKDVEVNIKLVQPQSW